ncbi:uncharacterized protein [Parasteatoda tepidariorum]|uniref:uncharacterized protein n=1 Tax=Parasteatoda tepidariorum TaxID=114398 RepID=UPI001C71D3C6|nr:uncharacterized protein LOC122268880 [Parasteatoda tepidariorum]
MNTVSTIIDQQTPVNNSGRSRPPRDISLTRLKSYLPSVHNSSESPFKQAVRISQNLQSQQNSNLAGLPRTGHHSPIHIEQTEAKGVSKTQTSSLSQISAKSPFNPFQENSHLQADPLSMSQQSVLNSPMNTLPRAILSPLSETIHNVLNTNIDHEFTSLSSPLPTTANTTVPSASILPTPDNSHELDTLISIIVKNVESKYGDKFKLSITQETGFNEAIQKIKTLFSCQSSSSYLQIQQLEKLDHRISTLSDKVDPTHIKNLERQIIRISDQLDELKQSCHTPTYSEIAKRQFPPAPIIITAEDDRSGDDIVEIINDSTTLPIVKKVFKTKNFVEIKFHDHEAMTKLTNSIKNKLEFHDKEQRLTSLIILNAPALFDGNSISNILQHFSESSFDNTITYTKSIPHKKHVDKNISLSMYRINLLNNS